MHPVHIHESAIVPRAFRQGSIHRVSLLVTIAALALVAANARPAGQFPPARTVRPMDPSQQSEIQDQQAEQAKQEQARKLHEINQQRRKHISDETAALVEMATELKTEVDRTDQDTLSVSVVKKAADIEKLAHAIRENMKITVKN